MSEESVEKTYVAGETDCEVISPNEELKRLPNGRWPKGFAGGGKGGRPKTPTEIREAFQKIAPQAVVTLYQILTNDEAKHSDKVKAAEVILDRAYGKAPQTVTDTNGNTLQGVLVLPAIELPSIEKSR